jgi:Ca2+-binding RTX toxin-like protein
MCVLCGRPGLVHDLGSPTTTFEGGTQQVGAATLNGTGGNAIVVPSGSDAEITFISGVTSNATVAATSFGSWAAAGAPSTPAYSSSWSWTTKWGSTTLSTAGTPGGMVTYWFDTASQWTIAEQAAFTAALGLWSAEANISFALASSAGSANFIFHRATDGSAFQDFPNQQVSVIGSGTEGGHGTGALISIDTSTPGFGPLGSPSLASSFAVYGGYPFQTIVHEIGHLLGLGHAGPYNGNVNSATQQFSPYDTRLWSIMSYIDPWDSNAHYYGSYPVTGTSWGVSQTSGSYYYNEPTTPMMLDILAAQRLYGPATSGPLASGGQIFGFHSNIAGSIAPFFDFTINQHPVITIWDAGLHNTLDLSGWSTAATINLHPGSFSSANGATNNIAIAAGTIIETAIGGGGNDILIASDAGCTLDGGAGNDILTCGAGDDTIVFRLGSGADMLNGFVAGASTVDRIDLTSVASVHNFNDVLAIATQVGANTVLNFGGGNTLTLVNITLANLAASDFVFAGSGGSTISPDLTATGLLLTGTTLSYQINDVATVAASASITGIYLSTDSLITSADTLLATYSTPPLVAGGTDNESVSLTFPGNLTPGTYYLGVLANYNGQIAETTLANNASTAITIVLGDSGNNGLTGTSGNDTIYGLAGDDFINGGPGADTMVGGTGNDTYYVDSPGDLVMENPGEGQDRVTTSISGYTLPNNLEIGAINSATGMSLNANPTQDSILFGNIGEDILNGGAGNDQFAGGSGNDIIYGAAGNDILGGGPGNDVLDGGAGVDNMAGGLGNDTYFVDSIFDGVFENPGEGQDVVYVSISGYAVPNNVEIAMVNSTVGLTLNGNLTQDGILYGNIGNDVLNGGAGNDQFAGGSGNDIIYGAAGNDILGGGPGNDVLDGGAGIDNMAGGVGNDTYFVDSIFDGVFENPGEGQDVVYVSISGYAVPNNVEIAMVNSTVGLTLNGNLTQDGILYGNIGNDVLNGGAGNDQFAGGSGNDIIYGAAGNDILGGGPGNDVLDGGAGNDWIVGGTGIDNFSFSYGNGHDAITDFDSTSELLDLHGYASVGVTDFPSVMSHAVQVGSDVVITFDANNSILLQQITLGQLNQNDFHFS